MINFVDPTPLVQTGTVHTTIAVLKRVSFVDVCDAVQRHQNGDWGSISVSDANRNENALLRGGRLTSAFQSKDGIRFWVTTEPDRSKTIVLLPRDNRENNKPEIKVLKPVRKVYRRLFRKGSLLRVFHGT
jgi:hypothetical protein